MKTPKRRKHYTVGSIIWIIVEYASLIFFGLCAVVPLISCVITAFKTTDEYNSTSVMTLPKSWLNFDNFIKAFQEADMGRAFLNSVIVMVCVLLVSVVIGTQLAYVPGKRINPKSVPDCVLITGSCNAGNGL